MKNEQPVELSWEQIVADLDLAHSWVCPEDIGKEFEVIWDKYGKSIMAKLLKRESGWVFITFDEKGSIRSTPTHGQEVLFVYGESVYAGCFLDDIRESHYPDGEKYEGDFGFYTNDDKFFEAENVRCWMPSPSVPKRNEIEGDEP